MAQELAVVVFVVLIAVVMVVGVAIVVFEVALLEGEKDLVVLL